MTVLGWIKNSHKLTCGGYYEGYFGRLPNPLAGLEDDDLHGDGAYVTALENDDDFSEENEE